MKKRFWTLLTVILFCLLIFIIISNPDITSKGSANGIMLSGKIIIPSLFPFSVCVLYIMKSGVMNCLNFLTPITKKIFNLNGQCFGIFILSMIGGYPLGAKLLNEAIETNQISAETAGYMLNYCINAGPAFVILAVGAGALGSKELGTILFISHILGSLILSLLFRNKTKSHKITSANSYASIADDFTSAVSSASSAIFSICVYVIFFSVISAYLKSYDLIFLKPFTYLFEVTNAAFDTKNIYLISFLLGFSGISILCQIMSVGKLIKINYLSLMFSRILHGVISTVFCYTLVKIFKISVTVSAQIKYTATYGGIPLALSMLSMVIILFISLFSKKSYGNMLKDIV